MSKNLSTLAVVFLSGLGMFLGHFAWHIVSTEAIAEEKQVADAIIARRLDIVDASGRKRISMGLAEGGGPGLWFFDENGKSRLNLGLYGDGNSFVVLNDSQDRAVQILRTFGGNSAPVLVMKSDGTDRIVLGLRQDNKEPFFVTFDGSGKKNMIFGDW